MVVCSCVWPTRHVVLQTNREHLLMGIRSGTRETGRMEHPLHPLSVLHWSVFIHSQYSIRPCSSTRSTPFVCVHPLSTPFVRVHSLSVLHSSVLAFCLQVYSLVVQYYLLVVAKEVAGVCLEARYSKGCAWQQGWGMVFPVNRERTSDGGMVKWH